MQNRGGSSGVVVSRREGRRGENDVNRDASAKMSDVKREAGRAASTIGAHVAAVGLTSHRAVLAPALLEVAQRTEALRFATWPASTKRANSVIARRAGCCRLL